MAASISIPKALLLLTNDGELARALELPSAGWVRRYRARALGHTTQARLDALKDGTTVDGVIYGPMEATLDKLAEKADGRANVWITVSITEGKNREVRKVLESIGLKVNRLIRLAYGPFQLGNLEPGEVEEIGPRVIRELLADVVQLRNLPPEGASQTRSLARSALKARARRLGVAVAEIALRRRLSAISRPLAPKNSLTRNSVTNRRNGSRAPSLKSAIIKTVTLMSVPALKAMARPVIARPSPEGDFKPRRDFGDRKPYGDKPREWKPRAEGAERKPYGDRPKRDYGDRPAFKKPYAKRGQDGIPAGEAGAYERAKREFGGSREDRPAKTWTPRPERGDRPKVIARRSKSLTPPAKTASASHTATVPSAIMEIVAPRAEGDRPAFKKPYAARDGESRGPKRDYAPREGGERKSYGNRPSSGGFKGAPRGGKPGGARSGGKPPFKPRRDS